MFWKLESDKNVSTIRKSRNEYFSIMKISSIFTYLLILILGLTLTSKTLSSMATIHGNDHKKSRKPLFAPFKQ